MKSPPIIWLAVHWTNNWWKFWKILWPSQNIWTLNFEIHMRLQRGCSLNCFTHNMFFVAMSWFNDKWTYWLLEKLGRVVENRKTRNTYIKTVFAFGSEQSYELRHELPRNTLQRQYKLAKESKRNPLGISRCAP